jgi:hypothetical protein
MSLQEVVAQVEAEVAARLALNRAVLTYCRVVATLPPEVRTELVRLRGPLDEIMATGEALQSLTDPQLAHLAAEVRVPTDHGEIRRRARRLIREQREHVSLLESLTASLLGTTGSRERLP